MKAYLRQKRLNALPDRKWEDLAQLCSLTDGRVYHEASAEPTVHYHLNASCTAQQPCERPTLFDRQQPSSMVTHDVVRFAPSRNLARSKLLPHKQRWNSLPNQNWEKHTGFTGLAEGWMHKSSHLLILMTSHDRIKLVLFSNVAEGQSYWPLCTEKISHCLAISPESDPTSETQAWIHWPLKFELHL